MRSPLSRQYRLIGLSALVAFAAGCASHRMRVDFDERANFSTLRSFAWVDSGRQSADRGANPFLERRLRRAIDQELLARGFVAASPGQPADMLVTAFVLEPTASDVRTRSRIVSPCGPTVAIRIGILDPFFSYHMRPWPWRSPYLRQPWGYACGYRIGIGYAWIPLWEAPRHQLGGTLVIDILDPTTRTPIWRGERRDAVSRYDEGSTTQESIALMVRELLRAFPPRT